MSKRIIYKTDDNKVAVIIPTQEALSLYGIEAIAKKDVPYEMPYKIVNSNDIPTDRKYREAWVWDNNIIPDGFGGESNKFDTNLIIK